MIQLKALLSLFTTRSSLSWGDEDWVFEPRVMEIDQDLAVLMWTKPKGPTSVWSLYHKQTPAPIHPSVDQFDPVLNATTHASEKNKKTMMDAVICMLEKGSRTLTSHACGQLPWYLPGWQVRSGSPTRKPLLATVVILLYPNTTDWIGLFTDQLGWF